MFGGGGFWYSALVCSNALHHPTRFDGITSFIVIQALSGSHWELLFFDLILFVQSVNDGLLCDHLQNVLVNMGLNVSV